MSLLDLMKKKFFIASQNNIIRNALSDNTDYDFTDYHSVDFIEKADILIIDSKTHIDISSLYKANNIINLIIINLTKAQILKREIAIPKPLFLQSLIKIINKNAADPSLFPSLV